MRLHDLEPDSIQPIVHVLDLHGGIGTGKVRELTNERDASLDKYIEQAFSVSYLQDIMWCKIKLDMLQ